MEDSYQPKAAAGEDSAEAPAEGVSIEAYQGPLLKQPLAEVDVPSSKVFDLPERSAIVPAVLPVSAPPRADSTGWVGGQVGSKRSAIKNGRAGLRLLAFTWLMWVPGLILYAVGQVLFAHPTGGGCAGPFFLLGDLAVMLAPIYSLLGLAGSIESPEPKRALRLGLTGLALDILTGVIIGGLFNFIPFHFLDRLAADLLPNTAVATKKKWTLH